MVGSPESAGVLVVGAGPTGLALAIELHRRQVPYRIIDREPRPHEQSRATDIQPRTLEAFHDMGVIQAVLEAGKQRISTTMVVGTRRAFRTTAGDIDTPYPYVLGMAQHVTERILERHLEALGGAVERGVRLAYLDQRGEGIAAALLYPDQTWDEPRFDYLVGCDGAHSVVRHALGIPFEGTTFAERFFLADLRLDCGYPDDETVLFSTSHGMAVVLPIPGERKARVFGDLDPSFEGNFDETVCRQVIRERMGESADVSQVSWATDFRVHSRQVSHYRKGRALLCGDAAHIHSPVGGRGMNTGIQDAYNLGWKLGLVVHGHASPALLDSYHAERHPIAKELIAQTDSTTRVAMIRNRFGQEAVGVLAKLILSLSPIRRRMLEAGMELKIAYPESPIVAEYRASVFAAHLTHDADSEEPSVSDYWEFSAGPGSGHRAPDATLAEGSLFDHLRGTEHTLLVFDGMSTTEAGYQSMAALARSVTEHWPGLVRVVMVLPRSDVPESLSWDGPIIHDVDRALHARYGAGSECLYLIRPDGYIGFRAQPADPEALTTYLASLFDGPGE